MTDYLSQHLFEESFLRVELKGGLSTLSEYLFLIESLLSKNFDFFGRAMVGSRRFLSPLRKREMKKRSFQNQVP